MLVSTHEKVLIRTFTPIGMLTGTHDMGPYEYSCKLIS